jgi:diguanylate cyclase (GGDEF)-like protein
MRAMQRALQEALESARTYQAELEEHQSRLRRLNMQLHAQAITDPLTGLYNRLALTQQLNQAVARAKRADEPISLLLIDVDHFKSFNDTYGHLAGDDALRRLAEIIRSTAREADSAARYGGEEFVVVLPATAAEGAATVAERIRQAVQRAQWTHRAITISIGVVTRQAGHLRCSAELLFEDADQALYRAKNDGRNRIVIAGPEHA